MYLAWNCELKTRLSGTVSHLHTAISRKVVLSGKVHATILKGIVGGFEFSFFQRNLKELARNAMEMCLRVLKESNKSRIDSYSRQEQCIDHIVACTFFPTTFLEIAVYVTTIVKL